jgi:hypothetical protein
MFNNAHMSDVVFVVDGHKLYAHKGTYSFHWNSFHTHTHTHILSLEVSVFVTHGCWCGGVFVSLFRLRSFFSPQQTQ